jgi:hypothetical protein
MTGTTPRLLKKPLSNTLAFMMYEFMHILNKD